MNEKINNSQFVDISEDDLNQYICGICFYVLVNPVFTECCRQSYCSDCINQWLTQQNTCPNDRKVITFTSLIAAPRIVINLINNLIIINNKLLP